VGSSEPAKKLHPFIENQDLLERSIDLRFEDITSERSNNNNSLLVDFGRFEKAQRLRGAGFGG
jgi:hypothetical protein